MANLLMVPGRSSCAGIDHTDFRALRLSAEKGSSRSMIEKAWTAIKDCFCGTKVGAAKDCLLKLYSAESTDAEKLSAFRELKNLAAEPYQKHFVERQEPSHLSIWLFIGPDAAIIQHDLVLDDPKQA